MVEAQGRQEGWGWQQGCGTCCSSSSSGVCAWPVCCLRVLEPPPPPPHTPTYAPTPLLLFAAAAAAAEEKEARQAKLADAAWRAVCAEYDLMRAAIRDPAARGTDFTQPWLDFPPVKLE